MEFDNTEAPKPVEDAADVEGFRHSVDEIVLKVDELEQRVNDVSQFYSSLSKKQLNSSRGSSAAVKEKEKDRQVFNLKRLQQEASKREAAAGKRMQELIRHFGTIFRQITAHKSAWPFMHPVDVEGLGLVDYYEVIDKPMDFSTIKNQMEAKDGTGYKNIREICADIRLVFKNAMTYNDDRNAVHAMAKSLLKIFEEKWLKFLRKVVEEETLRKEEEADAKLVMQLAQEANNAKLARHINNDLSLLDQHLDELREMVVKKCKKMSVEEKRQLGAGLSKLSPEDLTKALEIIAMKNPEFQAAAEEVDIDMDAQSEATLWRLKFFVKGALEANKGKDSVQVVAAGNNENSKRKREICDALAKTAKKRSKKLV